MVALKTCQTEAGAGGLWRQSLVTSAVASEDVASHRYHQYIGHCEEQVHFWGPSLLEILGS